jgi:hypothetical protein
MISLPFRNFALVSFALALLASTGYADELLIDALEETNLQLPNDKATARLVSGQQGSAVEFRFEQDSQNVFVHTRIRGEPKWDESEGFSFWVKGDGSSNVGVFHFIYDDDYSVRYEYAFSLKGNSGAR